MSLASTFTTNHAHGCLSDNAPSLVNFRRPAGERRFWFDSFAELPLQIGGDFGEWSEWDERHRRLSCEGSSERVWATSEFQLGRGWLEGLPQLRRRSCWGLAVAAATFTAGGTELVSVSRKAGHVRNGSNVCRLEVEKDPFNRWA